MTLRYGDRIELAIWLAGGETAEHLRQFMEEDARAALTSKANKENVLIGDPEFVIKKPGDDRVPEVPKWLEQKCISLGRMAVHIAPKDGGEPVTYEAPVLLVAEAMVIGRKPQVKTKSFLADLGPKELADLRRRTKEVWDKSGVGWRSLTDQECDKLIEEHGPGAAYDAVLATIGGGTAH